MPDRIDSNGAAPARSRGATWARNLLRLAILGLCVWGGYALWVWVSAQTHVPDVLVAPSWQLLTAILLAYAVLIAIPFVPGVEIGVVVLMIGGAAVAPLVYGATLLGLALSYAAGYGIPYATLSRLAHDLRMLRLAAIIDRTAPLAPEERLAALSTRLPRWLAAIADGRRYVLLGILINLPGSSLIGGGGGLSLAAGLTRLYRPVPTVITFAIAVAPVPILVWLYGTTPFGWSL